MDALIPRGPHGGDGSQLAELLGIDPAAVLDLSASLNPVAPHITDLVARHLDAIKVYPDPTSAACAVAEMVGVDSDRVVMTNGGAEAIAVVAQLLPSGRVHPPEFSLYERHLVEVSASGPLWRSNPNNPTGLLADSADFADVWDEAFYVLATGDWTRGDGHSWRLGSLTKAFACPGLRIGFIVVPESHDAADVRRLVPRWSLNAIAAAIVPDLVELSEGPEWCSRIDVLRSQLSDLVRQFGLVPEPSDSNFVVVRDCPGLRDGLARQGVLIRDTTSFGFSGVRIAVPSEAGLERLAAAMAATL
ncbi:MAG: aminotransferase class I/II-fold pyridoxal phosphate-dependent enzyme [Acidimicrobiales bacterium]